MSFEVDPGEADAILHELVTHQFDRELAAVDGALKLAAEVGETADVILVSVSEHYCAELAGILPDICVVLDDAVNTGHALLMSLPYSNAVMFLPISHRPPSGMIFNGRLFLRCSPDVFLFLFVLTLVFFTGLFCILTGAFGEMVVCLIFAIYLLTIYTFLVVLP